MQDSAFDLPRIPERVVNPLVPAGASSRLTASPRRITGTPTTRGTFSFVVRVTDSRGAFAERTFSITVT